MPFRARIAVGALMAIGALVSPTSAGAQASSARVVRRIAQSTVQVDAEGAFASGFVVGGERWIVTTHCAVEAVVRAHPWGDAFVAIHFASGTNRRARVLRVDVGHDLALLEVEGRHVPAPPLELAADPVDVGGRVLAVGRAFGLAGTLSSGIVVGRMTLPLEHAPAVPDLVLTDAALGPGSAGSPLTDARGRVIGVSVANDRLDPRLAFAIPADYVRAFVASVRAARAAGPAGLAAPGLADLGIRGEDDVLGVHVLHVEPGSPADRAGLVGADVPAPVGTSRSGVAIGHVITALDGRATPTVADLIAALATCARGRPFHLTVRGNPDARSARSEITIMLDPAP